MDSGTTSEDLEELQEVRMRKRDADALIASVLRLKHLGQLVQKRQILEGTGSWMAIAYLDEEIRIALHDCWEAGDFQ